MTDNDILQDFEEIYIYEAQQWVNYWNEAYKDLRYYLGDQWNQDEIAYLEANHRNAYVFNRIRRLMHVLTGLERKNRLSLKALPIEGSDDKTADQFTGVIDYDMKRVYPELGRAFMGSTKVGINLLRLVMNYDEDLLSGDICGMRYAFNQFILDSNFSRPDLKDCQHILTRRYVHRDAAIALLPDRAKDLEKLEARGPDNKFDLFYDPFRYDKTDSFRYDEFWRRSYKKAKVIIDKQTGQYLIWSKEAGDDFKRIMSVTMDTIDKGKVPRFIEKDRYIPSVEYYVFVENELMFKGTDPTGLDDYPFIAEIAYYDPEYTELEKKLQGVIRCMRDPQDEVNKRRSKMIDLLDSQINTGWEVEEGSTPAGFEDQYWQSGQAKVIMKKEGKMEASRRLQTPDIPPGIFQIAQLMDGDVDTLPGGNQELFGLPENDNQIAGVLAKMRSNAALVAFQSLFDDHRETLPLLGKKLMRIAQLQYHPKKIERIIGEPPTEKFYDEYFSKYDCTATEGLLTDTQRQMYYLELKDLQAIGAPIPWSEIIEAAPMQFKDRLKEAIKAGEQGQAKEAQMQALLDQLTQMMMQAKINSDNANAEAKRASIPDEKAKTMLETVKVAHELDESQDQRLFNLLQQIMTIAGSNQPTTQPTGPGQGTGRAMITQR